MDGSNILRKLLCQWTIHRMPADLTLQRKPRERVGFLQQHNFKLNYEMTTMIDACIREKQLQHYKLFTNEKYFLNRLENKWNQPELHAFLLMILSTRNIR